MTLTGQSELFQNFSPAALFRGGIYPFEFAFFTHETPRRCPKAEVVEIQIPLPGRKEAEMDDNKMKKPPRHRDDTIIIVEYAWSESARESVYDKVKRMIMNEPVDAQK